MISIINENIKTGWLMMATDYVKDHILIKVSAQNGPMRSRSGTDNERSPRAGRYSAPHKKGSAPEVDENNSVILQELLLNTDGLYEVEVHQLAYLLDVFAIEHSDSTLFNAEYTPDYYGIFSDEISMTLQQLAENREIQAVADMFDGSLIAKYDKETSVDVGEDLTYVVEHVLEELEQYGIQELIQTNKSHRPRRNTNFGEYVDFKQYRRDVEEGVIERIFEEPPENIVDALNNTQIHNS